MQFSIKYVLILLISISIHSYFVSGVSRYVSLFECKIHYYVYLILKCLINHPHIIPTWISGSSYNMVSIYIILHVYCIDCAF